MAKKIYVGNMNYATTEDGLQELFSRFGEVVSVTVIKDRNTQQSKGFGFVEMADETAADAAINELNGKDFEGRRLRVNIAEERSRENRPRRFDNREGGYGNGGGYGGYNRQPRNRDGYNSDGYGY